MLALVAGRQDLASPQQSAADATLVVSEAFQSAILLFMTVNIASKGAFQCIAQPNTTLLDCIVYQMQYLYDPGIFQALQISVSLGKCI